MAQLKDTTIQGSARVTDTLYSNAVQAKIFNIPTASNGTTYGPGTDGQVLKSNGASVYWASDSNSDINVKQLAAITTSGAYPIILANSTATTEVTGTVNKSANLTYNPSTKALSTGGTINGLTFTAASTGFTIAGGTTSKTLTVSNTYTLGAACAKGVTDNSSNADVTSSDTNLITGRTLYYQLAKKGYTTNTGTVTSVQVQASSPLQSSTSTAQSATLSTTISFTNQDPNKVLAGPSSGSSAGAPSFRALVAADIPSLDWSKIGSGKPTTLSGYGITDAAALDHTQAVNKGGTNITSYTIGDILYASASTTLSKLAGNTTTTVKYLKSVATTSGTAVAPAWAQIAASEISGLGAAAAKAVTDNSSNADVTSTDTNLITGRTLYYQLAKKGYTTNTGTVTSVTLTSGSGITVSDSGTAITGSGSRTISITGMNTSSGSTSKCLTEKGTWASFTNNAGTVTSVQVAASDPLQSSTGTASSTTLSTTISFKNQSPNKVLAGPSSGSSAGAPSFRALVAADIPNLSWNKITSDKPTTVAGYGITDAVSTSALSDYVVKTGDTMSGSLTANIIATKAAANPEFQFKNGDGTMFGAIYALSDNNTLLFREWKTQGGSVFEDYYLPNPSVTTSTAYNILTSKVAVTVAQGGTGATDAATARTNLGLGSMATASTGDYLALAGGTMTGTITLNNGVAMNTANEAGWSMNQYGNLTHRRTNENDYLGIVGSVGDAIRFYYDTGEAKANTMTCTTAQPQCIEIRGMSSSAGHGGFIDFHYNNSSADYTSRIIEGASGQLTVSGALAVNSTLQTLGGAFILRGSATPQIYLRNASNQELSSVWASGGRIYLRERPSAGSNYYTDIVFPAAYSSSNGNKYVYTSDNFSLSGTTLTITPPS